MASSNFPKQTKDVPFFHDAIAEFTKFKRDLITLAKHYDLFRVFTEEVEEISVEQIQAMGFNVKEKFGNTFWPGTSSAELPHQLLRGKFW